MFVKPVKAVEQPSERLLNAIKARPVGGKHSQRKLVSLLFKRGEKSRFSAQTKRRFLYVATDGQVDRMNFLNASALPSVWDALAPFLARIPGAFEALLAGDSDRIASVRDVLDVAIKAVVRAESVAKVDPSIMDDAIAKMGGGLGFSGGAGAGVGVGAGAGTSDIPLPTQTLSVPSFSTAPTVTPCTSVDSHSTVEPAEAVEVVEAVDNTDWLDVYSVLPPQMVVTQPAQRALPVPLPPTTTPMTAQAVSFLPVLPVLPVSGPIPVSVPIPVPAPGSLKLRAKDSGCGYSRGRLSSTDSFATFEELQFDDRMLDAIPDDVLSGMDDTAIYPDIDAMLCLADVSDS